MNITRIAQLGRLRLIIAAVIVAIAGLLIPFSQVASARTAGSAAIGDSPKPSIVLVHGAWADTSSWDGVIQRLQHDGHTVYAPPNPLQGLPYDAAYLADFLHTISGPIVLVGHSYGGAVITNAATGDPQVKALVYVDAFAPAEGQTLAQLLAAYSGSFRSQLTDGTWRHVSSRLSGCCPVCGVSSERGRTRPGGSGEAPELNEHRPSYQDAAARPGDEGRGEHHGPDEAVA